MQSRTTIALYAGLPFFLASLGLTCSALADYSDALHFFQAFKAQRFPNDVVLVVKRASKFRSYSQQIRQLSAIVAFDALLIVAYVAWIGSAIAFVVALRRARANDGGRRAPRLLSAFFVVFVVEAVALAVLGVVEYALLGATSSAILPLGAATIAMWAVCVAIAIATCVVVAMDKRDKLHDDKEDM